MYFPSETKTSILYIWIFMNFPFLLLINYFFSFLDLIQKLTVIID